MAAVEPTTEALHKIGGVRNGDLDSAARMYEELALSPASGVEAMSVKEVAVTNLLEVLVEQGKVDEVRELVTSRLLPYFHQIPKAKTAKIIRSVMELAAKVPDSLPLQLRLCKELAEWCRKEKRTFLRHRVDARLATLHIEVKEYTNALNIINSLMKDVRRLDDKLLLMEISLLESRLHLRLRNVPKGKAALTAARSAANAVYVPPLQQAQIDMQSGVLHAEEKDYKTAFSYFYEAFEGCNALDDPRALSCLVYMLLCKIMLNQSEDVSSLISTKAGLKHAGSHTEAFKAIAVAQAKRSLKGFEEAVVQYNTELSSDDFVKRHLADLYDSLLEQNLVKLLEPFSRVEIGHIATLIGLPIQQVENKLSQMILDHKFEGTLDQGAGCILIFNPSSKDLVYENALDTVGQLSKVVDSLYTRSARVMA